MKIINKYIELGTRKKSFALRMINYNLILFINILNKLFILVEKSVTDMFFIL